MQGGLKVKSKKKSPERALLHSGHVSTLSGAFPTLVRALLTVSIFEHRAFIGAGIAGSGANSTKLLGEVTVTCHRLS